MPSAAAKIEKSVFVSTDTKMDNNSAINLTQDPQKIANSIIEKKIRNLEKRKTRLLELKAMEDKGQSLEPEQKNAVRKLENVTEMVDMLKDIGKTVSESLVDYAKQLKKQQKKDQQEKLLERQQQDLERVKLWINVQFILSRFSVAKKDLLEGVNESIKLEQNQFEALEKFSEISSPQNFDILETNADKINLLMEGSKREFYNGVSYSDLKETFIRLIDSKYFESIPALNKEIAPEETPVKPIIVNPEPTPNSDDSTSLGNSEPKSVTQPESTQPIQNNVQQLKNQLGSISFTSDTVVEKELHKDPAVVAVAPSGFTYKSLGQPPYQPALSTANGSIQPNVISNHYPPHPYSTVSIGSIPTQTYTNQSYATMIPGTNFIPVPVSVPHQMPIPIDQQIPIRNVIRLDQDVKGTQVNDKYKNSDNKPITHEQVNNVSNEKETNAQPSQDTDASNNLVENGHPNTNGHNFKRSNPRGGRGGPRNFGNNSGSFRGGRNNPKPQQQQGFGYFNNNPNNINGNIQQNNPNPNFNGNRPTNRANGGNRTGGPFRSDRGGPRNHFNQNYNQSQTTVVSSK